MHKGVTFEVLRGKHQGATGVADLPHAAQPGFWWVRLYLKTGQLGLPLLLNEGQLLQKGDSAC